MKKKLKRFLRKALTAFKKPEMQILPGQLAFFFVLSIIPLIAIFGSIATSFQVISVQEIEEFLTTILPKDTLDLLLPIVSGKGISVNISLFYISAIILASNGTHSMITASNLLYKIEAKDYLSGRIKALIMTINLIFLLLFVLLVPAFGNKIISLIGTFIKSETIRGNITLAYQLLKYPISLFLIFFNVKLLYTMAPDERIKSKTTTTGAIFTTIGWIIASDIYSFYVSEFAKYNLFYGSISNILILLMWVYLLAYIFVFGMALNASSRQEMNNV